MLEVLKIVLNWAVREAHKRKGKVHQEVLIKLRQVCKTLFLEYTKHDRSDLHRTLRLAYAMQYLPIVAWDFLYPSVSFGGGATFSGATYGPRVTSLQLSAELHIPADLKEEACLSFDIYYPCIFAATVLCELTLESATAPLFRLTSRTSKLRRLRSPGLLYDVEGPCNFSLGLAVAVHMGFKTEYTAYSGEKEQGALIVITMHYTEVYGEGAPLMELGIRHQKRKGAESPETEDEGERELDGRRGYNPLYTPWGATTTEKIPEYYWHTRKKRLGHTFPSPLPSLRAPPPSRAPRCEHEPRTCLACCT